MSNLKTLRASTSRIAKDFAGRASNSSSAVEAKGLLEEGIKTLEKFYETSVTFLLLLLNENSIYGDSAICGD